MRRFLETLRQDLSRLQKEVLEASLTCIPVHDEMLRYLTG